MTEQAGREKIAGGRNRNRLLISLPHLIRMSSGFLFSAIILLFAERITMLDVAIIMSVGIVLSYFLIRGDAVIIDQLVSYFRQKELSEEPAASLPTMHLNEKYLTNAQMGFFLRNQRRVYSRSQLLDTVWGGDVFVELRTVDVHIHRLRKVININNKTDLIRTVRSMGYSLEPSAE